MQPTPSDRKGAPSIAAALADFASRLALRDLPPEVWTKSVHHIVDAIGLAFASRRYPFAAPGLAGMFAAGADGKATVIGVSRRMAARDAAFANAYLIHGLDFDDTHPASIVHPTVACLPAALAVAETRGATWGELVTAYVAGMETAIRLGQSVKGAFHHAGYHATGLLSHFSASVVAGKLLGLNPAQLVAAQGMASSTASGLQLFLEDGAWTKRMHPGWGALAGITAAHMAQAGFAGPLRPYEGRFGLFETHLQAHAGEVDLDSITEALGSRWTMLHTAIKPYPVCHFNHGAAEAAIRLHGEVGDPSRIREVVCELPEPTLPVVAQPHEAKILPRTDYDAKFSAQYVVATALLRGRFGLEELTDDALVAPDALAMAARVRCVAEKDSPFPKHFSGAVTVHLADGTQRTQRVPVNLGSGERALSADDITAKFRGNAGLVLPDARVDEILGVIMPAGPETPVETIAAVLAAR